MDPMNLETNYYLETVLDSFLAQPPNLKENSGLRSYLSLDTIFDALLWSEHSLGDKAPLLHLESLMGVEDNAKNTIIDVFNRVEPAIVHRMTITESNFYRVTGC